MSRTSTGSLSPRERAAELPAVPESPEQVEQALRALEVRPSRGLGQSFLTDPFVADALAVLAAPAAGRPTVEVGGGLGIVTRALLRRGARPLTVVERDPRLADHLERTFGASVRVVRADALAYPFPPEAVVVGSLPYSVATPLLLGRMRQRQRRLAVLVQKEVAERLGADVGSRQYGRPTILARLFGEVELFQEVPAAAFHPLPKVAGRLLVYRRRMGPLPVRSVERLEAIVRALFSSRRKQLGNLLPRLASGSTTAEELARSARWPDGWPRLRPEDLDPEAYFRLACVLGGAGDAPPSRERADREVRAAREGGQETGRGPRTRG